MSKQKQEVEMKPLFAISLIGISMTLGMMAIAHAQDQSGTADCLASAQRSYKDQWARECAARSLGSNNCALPRLVASELRLDRTTDQNYCFSLGDRGMLREAPAVVMPGAGESTAALPSNSNNEPRRKFWISPQ
jgi:hypothetical protein